MTNYMQIEMLTEKKTHDGLSGAESELLDTMVSHRNNLSLEERECWDNLEF